MGLATPPLDYVEKRRNLFPVASGVGIGVDIGDGKRGVHQG